MGNVDLKFYLSIFLRRLPYFIVIAAFLSAVGIAVASILPPIYSSTATILVEAPQIPGDLARTTVPIDPVAADPDHRAAADDPGQHPVARRQAQGLRRPAGHPGRRDHRRHAGPHRARADHPGPARPGGATIIEVAFSSEDAQQAAAVTNELVTLILQENVELRTGRAEDTLDFFKGEVQRLSGELDRQSQKIMTFKKENENALPDSLAFRRSQQATLQERLLQYEREATALQDERERTVEIYRRTGRVSLDAPPGSPEEQELGEMRSQLARAKVIYSESNPNIRLLETRIAGLEKMVAEQREALGLDTEGMSDYEAQLAQLDGRLKFIAEDQARIQADIDKLDTSIQATPGNELALSELQRDYDNTQGQYNAAVERLATASVGERLEVMSKGERFSLIEPAVAPASPGQAEPGADRRRRRRRRHRRAAWASSC